jgi:hypothetical protein
MVKCCLVGLFAAIANVALIVVGENCHGAVKIGQSMGLVAFSLIVVAAPFQAGSETAPPFDTEIFNSPRMNLIATAEVAGAFLITQADIMRRLLGTARPTAAAGVRASRRLLSLNWEAASGSRAEEPKPNVRPCRPDDQGGASAGPAVPRR